MMSMHRDPPWDVTCTAESKPSRRLELSASVDNSKL